MRKEPTADHLIVFLGLQGFRVEGQDIEAAPRAGDRGRRIKVIRLVNRRAPRVPDCGSASSAACSRGRADSVSRHVGGRLRDVLEIYAKGLVESINSKIAALRVQARGYRNPEDFKLKIIQRCGLPDNPWAQIVL